MLTPIKHFHGMVHGIALLKLVANPCKKVRVIAELPANYTPGKKPKVTLHAIAEATAPWLLNSKPMRKRPERRKALQAERV